MLKRLTHLLLVFVVALAVALQGSGVRAMPMPADPPGMAMQQHCPDCPQAPLNGSMSDKMPACQSLLCAGAVAMLPAPVPLPGRVLLHAAYLTAPPARWTEVAPAPDPIPPRRIASI